MTGNGEDLTGSQGAQRRIVGRLPKITVTSRAELADVLRRWRWLLAKRATVYLGDTPAAREAVQSTVARLLEVDRAAYPPHVLRWALQTLRNECRAIRTRLDRKARRARQVQEHGGPVDPVLGALVGVTGAALSGLQESDKQLIFLAAEGLHPSDIAALLDESVKTISMRLYRARLRAKEERERLRREDHHGDTARSLLLPLALVARTKLRTAAGRVHRLLAHAVGPGPGAGVTLAGATAAQIVAVMIAALVPATSPGPTLQRVDLPRVGPASAVAALLPADRPVGSDVGQPRNLAVDAGNRRVLRSSTPAGPSGATADAAAVLVPANETPEDAQLSSAAGAASQNAPPAIVALGVGHACSCTVLFRSLDGGGSWEAAPVPAPPDAVQVALPPQYPQDPRIFLGSDATSGVADYIVPQFGRPAVPLPTGPGRLALARQFDTGDSQLFVAGRAAVLVATLRRSVAVSVDTVIAYPPTGAVASIATAGAAPAAVLILAPLGSVFPKSSASIDLTSEPAVIACSGVPTSCAWQGGAPSGAVTLATSPTGPQTATSSSSTVALSSDDGRTFTSVPAPLHAELSGPFAIIGGQAWATLTFGDAATVAWTTVAGWHDVAASDPALHRTRWLFAMPGDRLLVLLTGGGLRCTVDGGTSWHPRCP